MWQWIQEKLKLLANSDHRLAVALRLFIGIVLGVAFIIFAEAPFTPSLGRLILNEIGLATIVATVSVFAIELRAHDRLIARIVTQLTEMSQVHFDRIAGIARRSARDALPDVLSAIFKNEDPQLYDDTMTVIRSFESMDATHSWTDRVAKRFIGQLYAFVSENASSLAQASQSGGAYDITLPPSSGHLADIILAGMMDELRADDSYIVISDLSSWNGELAKFFDATVAALGRGVRVRRLICPFDYDGHLRPEEVTELLKRHWDESLFAKYCDDLGRPLYELGVLSRRSVLDNQHLNVKHVGVFHHATEIACFEPQHKDLSRMAFSTKNKLNADVLNKLWLKAHTNYRIADSAVTIVPLDAVLAELGDGWWT